MRLCARAFDEIEHTGTFTSFEDGTPEAKFASRHYHPARQFVLSELDWRFASKIFTAPDRADEPDIGRFVPIQMDKSVIRIREVFNVESFRVEGRLLYTDGQAPITYRATINHDEPTDFSPDFETCLVLWLACKFAPRWTTSRNRAERLQRSFETAIHSAAANESREATPETWTQDRSTAWSSAAFGGRLTNRSYNNGDRGY